MKILIITLLITLSLCAKSEITPNEVYSQVDLITKQIRYLLKHFHIEHNHKGLEEEENMMQLDYVRPRNSWQKTYEIMVKINILRNKYKLPTVEPINIEPVLDLEPDLVYEQTQRILTELEIFKIRMNIKSPIFKKKRYKNKKPIDVFNALTHASETMDELNKGGFTSSYVFGENMRVYNDLRVIVEYLYIEDRTIPDKINKLATPSDTFKTGMIMLKKIKNIQQGAGIGFVDFSKLKKEKATSSDVFMITQMIIAELQTIKAFVGLTENITPAAKKHDIKTPVEVDQLMSWNLRKLELITNLRERVTNEF